MFRFVLRKMLSKKWMVLALLIGNILLISITAGNPMYTQAMLQKTLTKKLESRLTEKNQYPGAVTLRLVSGVRRLEKVREYDALSRQIPVDFPVPVLNQITYFCSTAQNIDMPLMRNDMAKLRVNVCAMTDFDAHISITSGRCYARQKDAEGVIEAVVSQKMMADTNLLLDDILILPLLTDENGDPMRIRIVGVFTNSDEQDLYWVRAPYSFQNHCFIDPDLFSGFFLNAEDLPYDLSINWYTLLDYTAMRGDQAESLLTTAEKYLETYTSRNYTDNFSDILADYLKTAKKVTVTLWVLQVPVFILLAAFIFMVSRQMLEMEYNEIAVMKSRGAGRGQIFSVYLLQSVILSLIAFAVGIPLGVYLCQVLGSSNAFLEFVRRSALPVEINAQALIYAAIASLLSICAMVLPAARYSRTGIVSHKQKKNARFHFPLWQKLFLDVILLGISLYGLYTFEGQRELLALRVQEGASLDPLLFLSSSLFMIGAGLLAVRLLPLIVWCVYRLFRRFLSPALYASFLRVLRTRSSQGFIIVFLVMTIALGVFNAQAARTINQNAEDNLRYLIGADVVLQESWNSSAPASASPDGGDTAEKTVFYEPDIGRYEALEGVASLAKVYVNENVSANVGKGTVKNIRLMGIHTKDFGETAWFKDQLSDIHWYHYLNAMAQNSQAVLVSRNFQTLHGCKLGDSFIYRNAGGDTQRGIIYGFVDYFPGFAPVSYKKGTDGLYTESENYLIVAHLQQIQASWGVLPYQIWIRNRDTSDYLYAFAEENDIYYTSFQDTAARITEGKNDPVLQGTNGILTVGFIVVLLLCSVGFLIYWILSIKSRSLQFGIFRAMGMSMREIFSMLLNEQLYISGLSIGLGAVVGRLAAGLYMPLIQLAYAASDHALPLELISYPEDSIRLFSVIGTVILLCMLILVGLISHLKIAQALKLGED